MDLPHGFGDLIHIAPWTEQHGLRKPYRFLAQLIVHRALVPLQPAIQLLCRINGTVAARIESVLEKWFFIERRVTARARNALGFQRFEELGARQVGEAFPL